ncbi:MAG: hypothetical protein ACK5WV_00265 [Chryseotalea sp.]|jgi:hypothetical protein
MALLVAFSLFIASLLIYKRIFNPFTIGNVMVLLAVVIMPWFRVWFLHTEMYWLTDTIISFYLISFFAGLLIKKPLIALPEKETSKKVYGVIAVLLLVALPFFAIKFLAYDFSFVGLRSFYYEARFGGFGFVFLLVSNLLLAGFLYAVFRKHWLLAIFIFPMLALFGQKTLLLSAVLGIACMAEHLFKIKLSVILGGIATAIVGLIFLHYASAYGNLPSPFELAVLYFDYYDNLSRLATELFQANHFTFLYGEILSGEAIRYIPRFVWHTKPEIYSHLLIHDQLLPWHLIHGYTPSFLELIASPLTDFGFIGLLAAGLLRGYLYGFFYQNFNQQKNVFVFLLLFLLWYNEIILVFGLVLMLLLSLPSIKKWILFKKEF